MRISGVFDGRAAERLVRFVSGVKRVCGMPDYESYRKHMARRHPESDVLSERRYFEEHIQARYGSGASRCC